MHTFSLDENNLLLKNMLSIDLAHTQMVLSPSCNLLFFVLFASLSVTYGTRLWLRNRDSGESKISKSPRDHTRPEPHQPLTWMDFLSPQVSNR
jgi:hypothetical protein